VLSNVGILLDIRNLCRSRTFLVGRMRGQVNFRSEPRSTSFKSRSSLSRPGCNNEQANQKIANEADNIAQLDVEHMGLMS
jgi:hypothetical protein